jgi:hypothetical protein
MALERLLQMMEGLPLPVWSSVVVVEVPCEKGVQIMSPVSADTYDGRFQEILDLGYADCIRLGVSQVKDGALIVEVVFYSSPDPGFPNHRYPRHAISVAMHGPTRAAWNRMGIDPDADLA